MKFNVEGKMLTVAFGESTKYKQNTSSIVVKPV